MLWCCPYVCSSDLSPVLSPATRTVTGSRLQRILLWAAGASLLFSMGQTAVKLSGAEAADRAQCAAPD